MLATTGRPLLERPMSETENQPNSTDEDPTDLGGVLDADGSPTPQIDIQFQYIKDLSFENPVGPAAPKFVQQNPEVNVQVSTSARELGPAQYEVCLIIRGEARHEDAAVFIIELTYGAGIMLANVPDDAVQAVLLIEGARQIFPFARNIVAEVTRDGGFPPLFLQPIDFVQLFQDQHVSEMVEN